MIESIKIDQQSLKKFFDKQKVDIERLSGIQQEFSNSLFSEKESVDKLSGKFAQTVQRTEQRFSEVERAIEKHNADYAEKCSLVEDEVKKCQQVSQGFYSKISSEMEQFTANADKQYETVQKELNALLSENAMLSKSLLLAKGISIAALALSVVLLILILTGGV